MKPQVSITTDQLILHQVHIGLSAYTDLNTENTGYKLNKSEGRQNATAKATNLLPCLVAIWHYNCTSFCITKTSSFPEGPPCSDGCSSRHSFTGTARFYSVHLDICSVLAVTFVSHTCRTPQASYKEKSQRGQDGALALDPGKETSRSECGVLFFFFAW